MIPRLAVTLFATLLLSFSVHAHDYKIKDLRIDHPTARASKPGQPSGAAYMTIENKGTTADRLIGANAKIARTTEIHSMVMDGNVMKMRQVEAIEIKPDTTVVMQPGDGYHIMLIGLKKPLKAGDKFPLTLHFEKAGKIKISVWVEDKTKGEAKAEKDGAAHHHHKH